MKNLDTSYFCIEIASVALGHRALNAISSLNKCRLIEAATLSDRFFILASAPDVEAAQEGVQAARSAIDHSDSDLILDSESFEALDSTIVASLYSLSAQKVLGALLIVESDSVTALLQAARGFVDSHGLKPIEIKIRRSGKGAYGFFTGPARECALAAEEARSNWRNSVREGRIEVIDAPAQALRDYFQFEAQS